MTKVPNDPSSNNPQQPIPGMLAAVPTTPPEAPTSWRLPDSIKNSDSPESDTALSEGFRDLYKDRFVFHEGKKKWLEFGKGEWWEANNIAHAAVVSVCKWTLDYLNQDDKLNKRDRQRLLSHRLATTVLQAAEKLMYVKDKEFDSNPDLAGLPEGRVVELNTGILRPATQEDRVTKSLGVYPDYHNIEPKLWLKHLDETIKPHCGNQTKKVIKFLQIYLGCCLTGHVNLEELFLFIQGVPASGKSTIILVILYILGEYARVVSADTLSNHGRGQHRERLARLEGARLVAVSELKKGGWDSADLNALISGEPITANHMHTGSFTFNPICNVIVVGNEKPYAAIDDGVWRRMALVECVRGVPENQRDPYLKDKLKDEAPGILAWCLQGALIFYRMRRLENPIVVPEILRASTKQYQESQNPMQPFLDACYFPEADCVNRPHKDIYTFYREWHKVFGSGRPVSIQNARKYMMEYGLDLRQDKERRPWYLAKGDVLFNQ